MVDCRDELIGGKYVASLDQSKMRDGTDHEEFGDQ